MIHMQTLFRRRGANDRGYALIAFIGLMVLLAAASTVFFSNAQRANVASKQSRGFVESGQALDAAVQQAIFRLNTDTALSASPGTTFATYPASSATAKTETIDSFDSRSKQSSFTWWIDNRGIQSGAGAATLHVSGAAITANRDVAIKLYAARVGSVAQAAGSGAISYSAAPQTLWTNAVTGKQVTITKPSSVTDATAIVGSVGILGGSTGTSSFSALTPTSSKVNPTEGVYRFGAKAQSDTGTLAGYNRPIDINTAFTMDTDFADQQLAQCGASSNAWVASEHSGRLYAGGDLGCYTSMNFDVPTTVVGTGVFSALVNGAITVNATVSVPTNAQLDIVATGTAGNVSIDASTNREVDAYIYAPQRNCVTTAVNSTAVLIYKGAIACSTVNMTAQFIGVAKTGGRIPLEDPRLQNDIGLNEVGENAYNTTIWYLGDYSQTTGQYDER
ncbi:hypothetical protein GCM10025867_47250 (plasmid) [Frondihabitans sucicola]|uniref:Type 4 fimbrial biogenesis protein PilX N-terminal domain-containing protein n=1 Tax=Frondihabitans sucicola TaxID=1268041 RepID=A0ABN6Y590_9MICO|nr:hypothetical protein [Frondihabitans sucicola]BDZ52484.1 hypothetical protein GCM10025867_47250 [Frondihabitans sucicola]